MKKSFLHSLFVSFVSGAILMISATIIGAQTSTLSAAPTIAELGWLAGDWQTAPGGRAQIEEHWTQPAGSSMLGMSRTVLGVKTLEFEYLRLEKRSNGIYYVAHPKGRCPGTEFKLTSVTTSEAVFENPAHDFPKRIIYKRTAAGLVANIDAGEGTKGQSFSYVPMKQ